jgi:hypothetical protein
MIITKQQKIASKVFAIGAPKYGYRRIFQEFESYMNHSPLTRIKILTLVENRAFVRSPWEL